MSTSVDYGKSLKLESDGRVALRNGDLVLLEGPENVAQRLEIALTTEYGEDQFNPDYGLDRFAILGSDLGFDDEVEVLKMQMTRTIEEDDQVIAVPEITWEQRNYLSRTYDFIIRVEIEGGESFAVNLGGVLIE